MTWIDDRIDSWHTGSQSTTLASYLGMSQKLYDSWLENEQDQVFGLDEVGFGSWAGPLVIGGVLAPMSWNHADLCDSKEVSGKDAHMKRHMRGQILKQLNRDSPGAEYLIHRTPVEEVDRLGVFNARMEAMKTLILCVQKTLPDVLVVVDGDDRIPGVEHVALPKADTFVPQVMAASLIAKVYRDTEMIEMAKEYPLYGFERHSGYATPFHQEALAKHGVTAIHRKSYRPIKELLGQCPKRS